MAIGFTSRRIRLILLALLVAAGVGSTIFATRTYHSFLLLRSAYDFGAPSVGTIRPWMTLEYLADTYRVPRETLTERLELPRNADPDASLRSIANRQGISPIEYVQQVQRVLAGTIPGTVVDTAIASATWLGAMGQNTLAGLLVYGYPALGLTLFLGAIGLPLPAGLATIIAGSLAAAGKISWVWSGIVALLASVAGDLIGYILGRRLSHDFLERRARWLGYTAKRRTQVELLFNRWGGLSVLLTRTLVSNLGPVVNLFAGAGRYHPGRFVLLAVIGRLLWTAVYLALGYAAGSDLEAASGFLFNLSMLLVFLAASIGIGLAVSGKGGL